MAYNWLGYSETGGIATPAPTRDEKQPNESWAAWQKRKQYEDDQDEQRVMQHKVLMAQKEAFANREKEIKEMKALALNGRPQGADVLGLNDPRSGGAMIAAQQAYDRNRAAVNNPEAMYDMLTKGQADVGSNYGRMRGKRAGKSLEQEETGLAVEQAGKDVERGALPDANTQKLIPDDQKELWQKIADIIERRKQAQIGAPPVQGTPVEPLRGRVYDVPGYIL